jgi:hypothetical protein
MSTMTIRHSPRLAKIPRVNYIGMDTIEPESEYDGITNIWADETIHDDPDYKPYSKKTNIITITNNNTTRTTPKTIYTPIYTPEEQIFVTNIKKLTNIINTSITAAQKAEPIYAMYKFINSHLTTFLKVNPSKWIAFANIAYNKTIEFKRDINKLITHPFYHALLSELNLAAKTLAPYCSKSITSRPRRNIPRINYTGMDTIEPESEYDGITDIWADETISYDPDYVFEEEEEYTY